MTLINVNLQQAHNAFLRFIVAANQQQLGPDVLNDLHQEKMARLTQYMDVLERLAVEGMEDQLPPQLSVLLEEWAIKEAAELLLRYQNGSVDPSHPGLQRSFWEKLGRQHQALSSELSLLLQQGREQRARLREEADRSWETVASRALENQHQQQQQWQQVAFQWVQGQQQMNQQWFQHQQQMFNHYQQANREWANAAMTGVQQAQLGVKQWYDFAACTQQHVAAMLAGTEQRQSVMVERAVQRANGQKWATRFMIIGLVLISIGTLFGGAFFMMMHLY